MVLAEYRAGRHERSNPNANPNPNSNPNPNPSPNPNPEQADMNAATVLRSLNPATNDVFRSQTLFATFIEGYGWYSGGGLTALTTSATYMIKLARAQTLTHVGSPVSLPLEIPLVAGWNFTYHLSLITHHR